MFDNNIDLNKILKEVEDQFNTHLVKAEKEAGLANLAKSENPFPPKDEKKPEDKKEEKKPEDKKDSKGEKPNESDGEQRNDDDKSKDHSQMSQEDKRDEGASHAAPGDHGYDDEDMDHMHKMYMSMSKAELKAHHDAVRKCLDGQSMQKDGDMAMAMSMDKSEKDTSIEVKIPDLTKEHDLLKSELNAEKSKTAELQKKVDLATEFMAKLAAKKSAP